MADGYRLELSQLCCRVCGPVVGNSQADGERHYQEHGPDHKYDWIRYTPAEKAEAEVEAVRVERDEARREATGVSSSAIRLVALIVLLAVAVSRQGGLLVRVERSERAER